MKKERFFRLLGDLDDLILDRYRQMDVQLSRKALRKKRTLRVLAVAACLVLLIGACVPVGMMVAQLGNRPSTPPVSINLQSLAELDTMREMIECEDEQALNDYLHSITGGGAQSRQDLIDFLDLVDNTPYARFINGEITGLTYNQTDERFSVSTEAENGESMCVSYELGMSDVEKNMEKAAGKLGRKNLLSAPLCTADGRLTLYTETREPSSNGDVIRWQGMLDGIAVYIVYWMADASAVDTAQMLEVLKITESLVSEPPTAEPDTTGPDSGNIPENGSRIWDSRHPDDSERYPYFSVPLAEFDNAVVERREGGEIYADGEQLIGGPGYHCSSFYLSDLTGDGYRELCFCMGCGSGMTDMRIVIIDFTTKETIFTMENRGYNDYYLFLRDGVLCVKETKYWENDAVRTGVLTYDGSKISIAWDSEVNATVDRDHAPVPGEPVN